MNTNQIKPDRYSSEDAETLERLLGDCDPNMTIAELLDEVRKDQIEYWSREAGIENDTGGILAGQIAEMEGLERYSQEWADRLVSIQCEARAKLLHPSRSSKLKDYRE